MKNLSQVEREFYQVRVTGANTLMPFGELKRTYLVSQVGAASSGERITSLTKRWLIKLIVDNSGTPSGDSTSDLLKQAVAVLGYTVSQYTGDNWRELFTRLP